MSPEGLAFLRARRLVRSPRQPLVRVVPQPDILILSIPRPGIPIYAIIWVPVLYTVAAAAAVATAVATAAATSSMASAPVAATSEFFFLSWLARMFCAARLT